MLPQIDILENELLEKYPNVLEILLQDHTTDNNIFWATDNYEDFGKGYQSLSPITLDSITGSNGNVIKPRVEKNRELQLKRVKKMAEVYTPSWVCNEQNNLVDSAWFNRKNVFNTKIINDDKTVSWKVNTKKIKFPKTKNWKEYVTSIRLEIACGEAPYLASRYDTTTGELIPIENRIGLLDRKLRIINENTTTPKEWLNATKWAYKSIYGFEWQGDSLLLARETLLITFVEYYQNKFSEKPDLESIKEIAEVISWNLWQMDGLKGVVPQTCISEMTKNTDLFGQSKSVLSECIGCKNNAIQKHNGIYSYVKNWRKKNKETGEIGVKVRFVDLFQTKKT